MQWSCGSRGSDRLWLHMLATIQKTGTQICKPTRSDLFWLDWNGMQLLSEGTRHVMLQWRDVAISYRRRTGPIYGSSHFFLFGRFFGWGTKPCFFSSFAATALAFSTASSNLKPCFKNLSFAAVYVREWMFLNPFWDRLPDLSWLPSSLTCLRSTWPLPLDCMWLVFSWPVLRGLSP